MFILVIEGSSPSLRIDPSGVIKVADFGLSEDIYSRNYFRQGKEDAEVRLPIKWMALESLQDGVFSETTDVVGSCLWTMFGFSVALPSCVVCLLIHTFSQKKSVWSKCKRCCMPASIVLWCYIAKPAMLHSNRHSFIKMVSMIYSCEDAMYVQTN